MVPRTRMLALVVVVLAAGACRSAAPERASPAPARVGGGEPLVAGESVEGRPIPLRVHGSGPATVLFLASIHDDETAGTPLLHRLSEELARRPELLADRRAVVIPLLNPDGVALGSRYNARRVDLNRNFPASNRVARETHGAEPLSEPESRFLARVLDEYEPRLVLSFHQAANLIDWDGPGADVVAALAAKAPLPARRMGSRPGSLGSWVGLDRGVPVVTVEMTRADDGRSPEELWGLYGELALEALRIAPGLP